MSRLFGYYKKVLNDFEILRKRRSPETVAEAMRHHAATGEYPKDRRLRGQVKKMQLMAKAMAATIPAPPQEIISTLNHAWVLDEHRNTE